MTEPTFIHSAGRSYLYDRLKQTIKRASPPWVVAAVVRALRPYVAAREELRFYLRLRKVLPAPLARAFPAMYATARQQWESDRFEATGPEVEFPIVGTGHTVFLRPGTSDIILFRDIFLNEQYGRAPIADVRTVVDCGANIGLSSCFFLLRHKQARVLAVEPDPTNLALCERNLAAFGDRAVVVRGAILGSARAVVMRPEHRGTWAARVEDAPVAGGDPLPGWTLGELFDRHSMAAVDMLKIDIEGAEKEVFEARDLAWVDRVRCIQIELEPASRRAFFLATGGRGFTYLRHTEATVAYRP